MGFYNPDENDNFSMGFYNPDEQDEFSMGFYTPGENFGFSMGFYTPPGEEEDFSMGFYTPPGNGSDSQDNDFKIVDLGLIFDREFIKDLFGVLDDIGGGAKGFTY